MLIYSLILLTSEPDLTHFEVLSGSLSSFHKISFYSYNKEQVELLTLFRASSTLNLMMGRQGRSSDIQMPLFCKTTQETSEVSTPNLQCSNMVYIEFSVVYLG